MASQQTKGDVKDLSLAKDGVNKIEWAGREMPVLELIRERFEKEKPLAGIRMSACLHVTSETANLAIALRDGGADLTLCASNPLSTQDDVAAALVSKSTESLHSPLRVKTIQPTISTWNRLYPVKPQVTMDDGADLLTLLHTKHSDLLPDVVGGTEETTTGVIRLTAMPK
ncbi:MAG: hypothetical protein CM1200mP22_20150 [Dehalococcoidia bacterium]|nr:MAG: hypothetical protein CM1200mP22_20150 [Dehalococcoidia bacterium]